MTTLTNLETLSETTQPEPRGLKTPLDGLITAIATRFGGKNAKELERFIKFAMVGFLGAVVDFGTLNLLLLTVLPPAPTSRLNVTIATTIAFAAAVAHNFMWNRFWTYPDSRSRSMRRQLAQFAVVSVIGWLARTIWITVAYIALGTFIVSVIQSVSPEFVVTQAVSDKIGANGATFIGIFVVMIWNFFANRYWTYNDVN